jgi:hypothetical protein
MQHARRRGASAERKKRSIPAGEDASSLAGDHRRTSPVCVTGVESRGSGEIAPHIALNRSKTAPIASSGENVAMQHSGLLPHSPPDQVTWRSARHQMPSRRGQLPIAAGCSGAFLFFIGTLFRLIEAIRDFPCLHILSKRECFTG